MLKRFISTSLLLLVVAMQAFAADCELRCATMTAVSGHHGCGNSERAKPNLTQAVHCHGMAMESHKGASSLFASDQCHISICKFQSEAIAKQSSVDELASQASAITLPGQSILDPALAGSVKSAIHRSRIRQEARVPLDLRPGSSLRI